MRKIIAVTLLSLPLGLPAAANELPAWLGAVGQFIVDNIEPPRTAEDLLRQEEEERRLAALRPALPEPEPPTAPASPPAIALPAPPAIDTPLDPGLDPGLDPSPEPGSPPEQVEPEPAIAAPAPPPPRRPNAAPAQQPTIAGLPAFPPPEPIRPADRIAGTATLNQAIRLGGPADLYAQPIRRPPAQAGN